MGTIGSTFKDMLTGDIFMEPEMEDVLDNINVTVEEGMQLQRNLEGFCMLFCLMG